MEAFCNNTSFLLPVLSCNCFLVGFTAVNERPVPEHVQRKEHGFQALTLEKTWDLKKILHYRYLRRSKSYNDMYANKTVIQRYKVLSFRFGSV